MYICICVYIYIYIHIGHHAGAEEHAVRGEAGLGHDEGGLLFINVNITIIVHYYYH